MKTFQALFASVAIANNISVASAMPTVHDFTLSAMVNAIGLGTIFLTMVESAIALYLLDSLGLEKLYKQLDAISFTIFAGAYVALNVALPMAA